MGSITIHETTDDAGALVRTELALLDGSLSLIVGGKGLALPDGALAAVMKRYGKPLEARNADMRVEERLELGDGAALVRFRFLRRYDVIARDYLALYTPDGEPLCEMATSVAAALDHLARRLTEANRLAAGAAAPPPFYVSVAGATDVGKEREKNEDALVVADLTGDTLLGPVEHARIDVGERGVLLAVSDGMGGAQAGEVASALVVETLTRSMKDADPGVPRDARMNEAIQKAHRAVWDTATRESKKMGATLTAVFVHAKQAFIAEVGDSRAYLIRKGKISQLTHDQSMVQMLVDSGVIPADQAGSSPIRNIILQAMGNQPDVKVALAKLELRDRDCLVLCSDGLTTHVRDEEILDVVLASGRPEIAAQQLVDLANERGGKDNITVIVAGLGGSLSRPATGETIDDTFQVLSAYEPPGAQPSAGAPKK